MGVVEEVWPEWRVEELLGRGSYGKVYRVSRESMGHVSRAAVKVIEIPRDEAEVAELAAQGLDMLSVRSFLEQRARGIVDEITLMESLKGSPNVVGIEDYRLIERDNGIGWSILIRMELLEPIPARLEEREVASLGADICRALVACHAKGIVHRDVKPENIFWGEYGYKLGDFGIARRLEGSDSAMTVAGAAPYMAPEVFRGEAYGRTVDLYSLGLVLYRFLNDGRAPFLPTSGDFGPDDVERARQRRLSGEELPAPACTNPALAAIVLRACEADPSRRWPDAGSMLDALEGWLSGRAPLSSSTPAPESSAPLPQHVAVTLDPNGAEGASPKSKRLASGESFILPAVGSFSRPGFRATGWNTESDGSGVSISVGSSYVAADVNTRLYVEWRPVRPLRSTDDLSSSGSRGDVPGGTIGGGTHPSGPGGRLRWLVPVVVAMVAMLVAAIVAIVAIRAPEPDPDPGPTSSTEVVASSSGDASTASATQSDTSSGDSEESESAASLDSADWAASNYYALADSGTRVYSDSELEQLSTFELFIARNEILARHGYVFENDFLYAYFKDKDWYRPAPNYSYKLNSVEEENAEAIRAIEQSRNSPYLEDDFVAALSYSDAVSIVDATASAIELTGTIMREEKTTADTGMVWSAVVYWLVLDNPASISFSNYRGDATTATFSKISVYQLEQGPEEADKDLDKNKRAPLGVACGKAGNR